MSLTWVSQSGLANQRRVEERLGWENEIKIKINRLPFFSDPPFGKKPVKALATSPSLPNAKVPELLGPSHHRPPGCCFCLTSCLLWVRNSQDHATGKNVVCG